MRDAAQPRDCGLLDEHRPHRWTLAGAGTFECSGAAAEPPAANIQWTVWIRGGDATDLDEQATFLNTAANVYWFEGGVVIQTRPTGFGDYYDERVVPWSRVVDYRKERLDVVAA